jgi:ketosteroid isomerase-like protein
MYFNAVASTLAAVRRMVGDNWIHEYFRAADSLDLERLLAQHTDDVQLTVGNYPTVAGKEKFREGIGGLWSRIKGMSHNLTGAWSLQGDQIGIAESVVTYTRKDDSLFTANACTVLRRRSGKVADIRIHADLNGL